SVRRGGTFTQQCRAIVELDFCDRVAIGSDTGGEIDVRGGGVSRAASRRGQRDHRWRRDRNLIAYFVGRSTFLSGGVACGYHEEIRLARLQPAKNDLCLVDVRG